MTYLLVLDSLNSPSPPLSSSRRLTVASCGNAGLAAATIAAAAKWDIDVCIPDSADPEVVQALRDLGPHVNTIICPRDLPAVSHSAFGSVSAEGAADPTVAVFKNLIEKHGSIPLSVQGTECGLAVEGVQTLVFELLDQAAEQKVRKARARGEAMRRADKSAFCGLPAGSLRTSLIPRYIMTLC